MSFILDALRKLEHKRQRSSVPNLLTVHDFTPEKPKKRSVRLDPLIAVLLLNAGMLLIWLRPWQSADIQKHESMTTESGKEISDVYVPASSPSHNIAKTEIKTPEEKSSSVPDTTAAAAPAKQAHAVPQNQPHAQ